MAASNNNPPGTYITELNSLSSPVAPVATAVPAFIGYTPQTQYQGKSYTNVAQRISSFAEFKAIYCFPDPAPPADPAKQYSPQYYLVQQKVQPVKGDYLSIYGVYYSVVPDPNTIYYLYNSIRLFYENGGGDAYIVSVGAYGEPSKKPVNPGDQIVNPNVHLQDLMKGLALLQNEPEPTMYICPDATLLSLTDNKALMQGMLLQSSEMQTAISVLDIIGGRNPDPLLYTNDIVAFRSNTGLQGLNYGAAYYPFIGTTIMQGPEIDYTNLFGGDITQLQPVISPQSYPNPAADAIISAIQKPVGNPLRVSQYNAALLSASEVYTNISGHVLNDANILPPSGAMAGVITTVDNQSGVWVAPANISIETAAQLTINISDSQQGYFNVDPVSGKSINVIRSFPGKGILVWGARTLDGNSQDWRYIPIRRTMIFLEQSCKLALQAHTFQPNDSNTWAAVTAMLSGFLTSVWEEGGLQGASPADAFSVACGLGTTMTADDILNGFLNVSMKVAIAHPAEFLVITLQQQMAVSA